MCAGGKKEEDEEEESFAEKEWVCVKLEAV